MIRSGKSWSVPVLAALLAFAVPAPAQPFAESTIELDGETVRYSIRAFPPGANLVDPAASVESTSIEPTSVEPTSIEPASALSTAKLLNRHLTSGAIEDAALLSNAPRRRYEVLRDYKASVGDDGFKQVFGEYFYPENRVVAEVAIGAHSLLVWHLREGNRYAGQYYVRIGDRVLMDDAPSEMRGRLRRVLEAIRTGRVPLPRQ